MIKIRPVVRGFSISLKVQVLPEMDEMKRRWMNGEDPLGGEIPDVSKKKLKHRAKSKMELRRIRRRLESSDE